MNGTEHYTWWTVLRHGGLLIAPARLAENFPEEIDPLSRYHADLLRRDIVRFKEDNQRYLGGLLDTVLETVLGLDGTLWLKGSSVGADWSQTAITRESIKPRRVWLGSHGFALPVFVDNEKRLGVGRGRRTFSRVVEWLRKADRKIALLTNGQQWRLVHAGADYNAWCEWDIDFWFEEGVPGPQVMALRILLGTGALEPGQADHPGPLLAAIQASRQGQAELSSVLGERVRQAVELLIRESGQAIEQIQSGTPVANRDLYIAANRMIMRCVIVLFAEARDLLPRDHAIYHDSYGIQGLREELDRRSGSAGRDRLRHSYSAWPRLLALFQLVYSGSYHEALPVPAYGGQLFAPGRPDSQNGVRRALCAFEDRNHGPSDAAVYRILELLTRSKVKVRQGRSSTWVDAMVDFSDLSSEYIGILYQGLLDFELRQADDAMVFLNLGDQPVLPLARLEEMDDTALSSLVEKVKKSSKAKPKTDDDGGDEGEDDEEDSEDEADAEETDDDELADEESLDAPPEDEDEIADDVIQAVKERAEAWAARAVKVGKLVAAPRSRASDQVAAYEADVVAVAKGLVARIVLPGEWFLVRWGGTRKGSGTFYTRPQLGVPLVRRTLQPLCYIEQADGTWIPRRPEEILALKVCDSATGSGSMLVASLRYLTEALFESLYYYQRIQAHGETSLCRLADGGETNSVFEDVVPLPPEHPDFEERLRARLKRHVVERCIYGVDLDPLAVELARLALWLETMDRSLPFEFLDHKVKRGNSLVGCWFDRFRDYPVMAWEREGGDKNHNRFVHHFWEKTATRGKNKGQAAPSGDVWTEAIKEMRNDVIKPEALTWITSRYTLPFAFAQGGYSAVDLHKEALAVFEKLGDLPVHDNEGKARLYREQIVDNPQVSRLRQAFDTWCAIWFWPGDRLDLVPTPLTFQNPGPESLAVVEGLRREMGFFHWELEFPDVFSGPNPGFDAMIENPPWEIMKPKSQEFFSNIDPLYRTYGKQEALGRQTAYFEADAQIETDWLAYNARFRALSNWNKHVAFPFGDDKEGGDRFSFTRSSRQNESIHSNWREQRSKTLGFADAEHPFRHQGSADINTYKMFLESSYALLRKDGRLGMIVPSGLYTDKGTGELRNLFLTQTRWEWLFGFINWNKIFDIHVSFKFCMTIMQKGAKTTAIKTVFSRYNLHEWEEAERLVVPYSREQVEQFSPKSKAILETRTQQDLDILAKIYENSVPLGDDGPDGWGITYRSEFHMTGDSKLFPPLPQWEKKGYQPDEYGHWLKGDWQPFDGEPSILRRAPGHILSRDGRQVIRVDDVADIALPLYEGRMVGQFDFSQKGWVSGKGRTAVWREIPWEEKVIEPQFAMGQKAFLQSDAPKVVKLGYLAIGSSTNARSMICSVLDSVPCGNAVPTLTTPYGSTGILALAAAMNSFAYDFALRCRLGGINLNYFIVEETPLLPFSELVEYPTLLTASARLTWLGSRFARHWIDMADQPTETGRTKSWWELQCSTVHERIRLESILNASVAFLYGLGKDDFRWMFQNSDHSVQQMGEKAFNRTLDPKGFWRVDKDKDPELRHTVLAQVAFHDLQEKGLDAFLTQNDGEGWMIPETLRLADYGLGHDDRAKVHQPVAARLGPRFHDWQLTGTPAESWEECERHAENLRLLLGEAEPVRVLGEEKGEYGVERQPQQMSWLDG